MNKWVRSHPFLVSFFLIGELSLSLGVSEPRHILKVIHYKHIGVLGKAIEHHGIGCTNQFHQSQSNLPKVKYLHAFNENRAKQWVCESVQIDPLFFSMCVTVLVLITLCRVCVSCLESVLA